MHQDEIDAINGVGDTRSEWSKREDSFRGIEPTPPADVYELLLKMSHQLDETHRKVMEIEKRVDEAIAKFIGSPGKVMGAIVGARLKGTGRP